jgi:hypothetical protein
MKSEETYRLEEIITLATWKPGTIGCAEVGLGDAGIVDYVTLELGGSQTMRCYELKITKSDFLSDAKKTFNGDFNFYVIPSELWDSVHAYIEPWVGCWTIDKDGKANRKKPAKRMKTTIDKTYVMRRIVQSLERQHLKYAEKSMQEAQLRSHGHQGTLARESHVSWNGKRWVVTDVTHERIDTVLEPLCVITPDGWNGNDETVKPSELTLNLDRQTCLSLLTLYTYAGNGSRRRHVRTFGCQDVGIDGHIADYVTIDDDKAGLIRCYAIVTDGSELRSLDRQAMIGDYNLCLMPTRVWDEVRSRFPSWLGCLTIDADGSIHRTKPARRMHGKVTWQYMFGRMCLALEREHLKSVERDWLDVQLARPITDYNGMLVHIGDTVQWHGRKWSVSDVIRERNETVLEPMCVLTPSGWHGNDTQARPSATRLMRH